MKIDKKLANAIARFFENAVESKIYSGEFREELIKPLLITTLKKGDSLSAILDVEIIYNDVRMLKANLAKGEGIPVQIELKKEEGGQEWKSISKNHSLF